MRTLLLLLVLINVALFAYFNSDKIAPKKQVSYQELNPEKLKLLMDANFKGLEKKQLSSIPKATPLKNCYKWSAFTDANLAAAQEVMARLGLNAELVKESGVNQERRFWIYYPPLATFEKAQAKAGEIKKLGVDELYIVQDTKWRNAISFGLFSDETLANNLLKQLRLKGVNHAIKSVRNQGNATTSILAKGVNAEEAVELYKVRPEFVGTEVTPVACQ